MYINRKFIFVAGAPRCGTTSLFRYLNSHPNIYGHYTKETCYFLDQGYFPESYNQTQLFSNYHAEGLDGYLKIFAQADDNQILLDATPDYLYQQTFRAMLSQFEVKPLLVFCLRKPAHRIYSMYKYAISRLGILPAHISFTEYIQMVYSQDASIAKHNVINNSIEQSKYVYHIDKLTQEVGRENILLIPFEDFTQNPKKYLQKIAKALDLSPKFYEDYSFERFNESYEVKNQFFRKIYEALPLPIWLRYGDSKLKLFLKQVYEQFNTSPKTGYTPEELELIEYLNTKEFSFPNQELQEKYDFDISFWKS